jgi:hypothetical protein
MLGVKLADAHASLVVRPARDRQIEPEAAQWTGQQLVNALPMVGGLHHRYTRLAA